MEEIRFTSAKVLSPLPPFKNQARIRALNLVAVLGLASLVLGYGISRSGVASAVTDPVSQIRAQDEALYAHISLQTAIHGGWLTPVVMGRFLLEKPPLFLWMSSLSVKWFGPWLFALRLPSLVAAVLATGLVFLWVAEASSLEAGWVAAALLLSNPLWHVFARLAYMDMLFTLWLVAALYTLHRDPDLSTWRMRAGFAAFTSAAIMTKSIAGLIPLLILGLTSLARRDRKIGLTRIMQLCALIALAVAPWHLYQIWAHPQWLWADYVQKQLFAFGTHPPVQNSNESQVWFYLRRLTATDPVLIGLAALGLPGLVQQAWRNRQNEALALAASLASVAGALLAFRYRNLPYALYIVPFLAVLGAIYSPRWPWRPAALALAAAFVVKLAFPAHAWGLPLGASSPLPPAAELRSYAEQERRNELIIVSPDDNFYACTLALPHLRYVYIDPTGLVRRYAPHFAYLGITVTVPEFMHMDDDGNQMRTLFLARLRDWGIDSDAPLATAIVAQSEPEIADLVAARPHTDFLVPAALGAKLPPAALSDHLAMPSTDGWFLLARQAASDVPRSPFAERPPHW